MSGEIHLRGLALGQHSSEETSQRWRAIGDTVADLTRHVIESMTSPVEILSSQRQLAGSAKMELLINCVVFCRT